MSEASSVGEILNDAKDEEKRYEWLKAADIYQKALTIVSEKDFLKKGEICESLAHAVYKAAFQAESNNEFRERMHQAVEEYQKAAYLRAKGSETKKPKTLRCDAMVAYTHYWLASEVPEKKRLLDKCWLLTMEALKVFNEAGDALGYGKTYNQLASSAFLAYVLEWNFQAGERIIRDAMEHGERTVDLLSKLGNLDELARAYVKAAFYITAFGYYFVSDLDERERLHQKGQGYLKKAIGLSEQVALLELLSTPGSSGDETGLIIDEMLLHFEKALDCAEKTRDKFLIGTAMDWLAYVSDWKAVATDDPDKRTEFLKRALQYAEDAKHHFSSLSFVCPRGDVMWTGAAHAYYYAESGFWETDLRKRRDLLEKGVTEGTHSVELAESTGYPRILNYVHSELGKWLLWLAQMETRSEEKKRLLEKGLEHMKETFGIGEQLYPFNYWNRGGFWERQAELKAELSNVEKDQEKSKNMLEEAISDKERGLQLSIKENLFYEKRGELSLFSSLGYIQYGNGEWLNRLYGLTNNSEHQRRAIMAFQDAAESYQKLNMASRVAECHWKGAKGYDVLGEHLNAAENFDLASNNYSSAAEKIPQLKDFYQTHALYMQAWSGIEKARHHHARQEYGLAMEHFEEAAHIHESLKRWNYLAPNYFAWVQLENAEELSRKEQSEEAIKAFEEAAKLFGQTKESIRTELNKIEDPHEKTMVASLAKASELRREYCIGRITLEDARILDKKGDHYSSSEKYGGAAEKFDHIAKALETDQEKKELGLITTLSLAWQKMTQAEAETSPALYSEAAQLFETAKALSSNEKAKMLALGHSRFCKALEIGTKFADTRDATLHTIAEQHLESAATYYAKAGFQNASEYSKAMEHLFDAYLYMDDAKRERDPEKKARLYAMAERVLQSSAGSFMKAEHPEKTEQVQRLLEKVKEERELALSLNEMLHAPSVVSTTAAFVTPAPTSENAVGLERFEHAEVNANLILSRRELKLGESLDLEIELANAGKGQALLTQIESAVPEGFELTVKPELYRVEGFNINMKGKRLDPLKAEEVRFSLKSKHKGSFTIGPTVRYLDENGNAKSHQPEPVTITVREMGIKSWIKGEE